MWKKGQLVEANIDIELDGKIIKKGEKGVIEELTPIYLEDGEIEYEPLVKFNNGVYLGADDSEIINDSDIFEKEIKHPWFNNFRKIFQIKNCKMAEKYIKHTTGIDAKVYKTDVYLIINFIKNNSLNSCKIIILAGVLYCLKEDDFKLAFETMKSA